MTEQLKASRQLWAHVGQSNQCNWVALSVYDLLRRDCWRTRSQLIEARSSHCRALLYFDHTSTLTPADSLLQKDRVVSDFRPLRNGSAGCKCAKSMVCSRYSLAAHRNHFPFRKMEKWTKWEGSSELLLCLRVGSLPLWSNATKARADDTCLLSIGPVVLPAEELQGPGSTWMTLGLVTHLSLRQREASLPTGWWRPEQYFARLPVGQHL